ncbi:MAG: hypothetical protein Q8M01_10255 [Rubrivivax sp.]|nr:hypothetical protein [Rubrivivax sp.]
MATRSPRHKKPVTIIELPEFEDEAKHRLDANSLRALYLLLAENPLTGTALPGYPGLLELGYAGHRILYAVGSSLSKVYLLRFMEPGEPLAPPTSTEGKALRKALDKLIKAGILLAVREALKEPLKQLWEWLQDLF